MSGIIGSYNIRGSGLVKKLTVDGIGDDAVTLAKMVAGTDGNVISYDASGDPVAIATGSDGQVLTSTGAGSPPAFEAAGGGNNEPFFFAYLDNSETAQSINDATVTKVLCDIEVVDTAGEYDNSSNYRFTPQTAGKYFVHGSVDTNFSGQGQGISMFAYIYKNGASIYSSGGWNTYFPLGTAPLASGAGATLQCVIDFNGSSDYVELNARIDSENNAAGTVKQLEGAQIQSCFGAWKLIEA